MCTQEVIWCACGHGEFLPIVKCQQAELTGVCFIMLYGDHRIVVPVVCSWCRLNPHARRRSDEERGLALTKMFEVNNEQQPTVNERNTTGTEQKGDPPQELADVVMTDFEDFTLDSELW